MATDTKYLIARLALDCGGWAVKQFFSESQLPVKVHYVDWQPRIYQKTAETASACWKRRFAGLFAGLSIWASVQTTSSLFPQSSVNQIAFDASTKFCSFLPGSPSLSNSVALGVLAASIGFGTAICAGTYDLVCEYLAQRSSANLKPIFSGEIQETVNDLIDVTFHRNQNSDLLQNALFYGPSGTGKTMLSKWIATNSNMNYIIVSGSDLVKLSKSGSHIKELNNIFDHIKSLTSPTILFIDEAESFCCNRDQMDDEKKVELLNAFLNLTGEPSSKVMVILATNRMETLDPAILNRMDSKLFIPMPDLKTRKEIIKMHLPFFFNEKEREKIFSEQILNQIGEATGSFSGRLLFKLLHRLSAVSQREALTSTVIAKTIQRFISQEEESKTHRLSPSSPMKTVLRHTQAAAG